MARDLRYIPPGSLVEITNRILHGRFLLRPSIELRASIDGALGRAQRRYGMRVVGYVFLSNHFHLLVVPDSGRQLALFMSYLQSKIGKEAGRLHGWSQCFFPRRYQAIVVSDKPEDHVSRLRYLLSQGCKEGLVASPKQWPGSNSTKALLGGGAIEGLWFDRSREYEANRQGRIFGRLEFAEPERIVLSPLPCWEDQSDTQRQAKARALVREIEAEVEERVRQGGAEPLGVQAVLAQDPHYRPAGSKRSPAPRFHAKSGSVRRSLERAYLRFYWAYREAAERLVAGEPNVTFPPGSFPPPAQFVAPCAAAGFG